MHPDRRLDDFAARQYGVFSLSQARSAGMTPKMIEVRRVNGAWIPLAPSVYALRSAPPKWERQMAAALLTKEGAIVAGRAAAYLHDLPGYRQGRPIIMVRATGSARSPLATVIRSRYFDLIERARIRGFETSAEADTIVTLARDESANDLERVVDEVLARGSCSAQTLAEVAAKRPHSPGLRKLLPIIEERLPGAYQPPTSELERLLHRMVYDPAIPPTTGQVPLHFTKIDATVDLYIPAWRLIVEGDGRRWHNRKADHERDRLRDNEATAHGLAVLRFTWEMLNRSPQECLDTLIRTGQVRAAS
ncbi:MAG TPA: type IV toxin-antitoxin system AbiEi family antitoxin domain-containing protein [Acidimicrobiia bacterium]|nr:type IV toxin-antitoxin system AbiEi family antitoxin domain-containing protein [Acidimicrobiia bacterium]